MGTRRNPGWGRKAGLHSSCGFSTWAGEHGVLVGCYLVPLCELEKSALSREGTWLGQKAVLVQRRDAPSSGQCSPGWWSVARFSPHWALCAVPNLYNCTWWPCVGCHRYLVAGGHFPWAPCSLTSKPKEPFQASHIHGCSPESTVWLTAWPMPMFSAGSWNGLSSIP